MSVVETKEPNSYMLTVRIRFSAMDDVEARTRANRMLIAPQEWVDNAEVKFQRTPNGKPPEGLAL